ncbi:MAG: hypothetical protein WC682_00565 [Parcubacteria group bacterium]|jgi:hypothetical protein
MEKDNLDPRKVAENLGDEIRKNLKNKNVSTEAVFEGEQKEASAKKDPIMTSEDELKTGLDEAQTSNKKPKKEELTSEEKEKVYKLKKDLEDIFKRKEFENYKKKNPDRLAEYIRQITRQAENNIKKEKEWDALDILLDKAKKSKATTLIRILEEIKNNRGTEKIKENWTLEEINERLKSAGAEDEDIKYFFTLIKKDRLDFLNSNDEDLRFRIGKLKEMRESDKTRQESAENQEEKVEKEMLSTENNDEEKEVENRRVLKYLGGEVERCRKEYVKKEDEVGVKISRLKNFFRNLISIDKTYEIEKELETYKEEYERALKNHLEAVVDILGISSEEELKNLLNYTKFEEKLNLINAKEDLKFENDPRLESFKIHFKSWAVGALEGYKNLLAKPRELITQKTGSKIKGFAGGMIAVGGAMAFASNYIPGLRNVTVPLSVAIATMGFQKRAQEKVEIEKGQSLERGLADLQTRLAGMDDNLKKEILKRELGMEIKDIPEKVIRETEEKYKRYLYSFGKAVAVSTFFYEVGQYVRGYLSGSETDHLNESIMKDNLVKAGVKLPPTQDETYHINRHPEANTAGIADGRPAGIHGMQNQKIMDEPKIPEGVAPIKAETIQETFKKFGIKDLDANPNESPEANPTDASHPEIKSDTNPTKSEELDSKEGGTSEEINVSENNEDIFKNEALETPEIKRTEFSGIELNNSNNGELIIKQKDSVIGTIAKFLEKNSDKLTEGKMGFDPAKYSGATLEEKIHSWSQIRANAIAKEFARANSEYNLNKVSDGSSIALNLNNLADIKIEHLNDQYHLGGEAVSQEIPISATDNAERLIEVKETIRLENATKDEMELVHKIGLTPKEYADLNDKSVINFLDSKNSDNPIDSSAQLKNILKYLIKEGSINNVNSSVSDAIRSLDEHSLGKIFDKSSQIFTPDFSLREDFNYSEYVGEVVKNELSEVIRDKSILGLVFKEIGSIKGNIISSEPTGGIFDSFKQVAEKTLGVENIRSRNDDTVAKYVVKSFKRAYELGKLDELKLALKNIKK